MAGKLATAVSALLVFPVALANPVVVDDNVAGSAISPSKTPYGAPAMVTTTVAGYQSGCSQLDTGMIDGCTMRTSKWFCLHDDLECLCKKFGALALCYDRCPTDARRAGALIQRNSICNKAEASPTPKEPLPHTTTWTEFGKKKTQSITISRVTHIVKSPATATKIGLMNGGIVQIWTDRYGNAHTPMVYPLEIAGTTVFKTYNANPTNAAANLKVPGLAAAAVGVAMAAL